MYLCGFDFHTVRGAHDRCFDDSVVHGGSIFRFVLQKVDVDGSAEHGLQHYESALLRRYYVALLTGGTVDA